MRTPYQPFSSRNILRFLLATVVVLSLTLGFIYTTLNLERQRYLRLEDRYVRIQQVLGREQTQAIIDASYD